MLYFVIALLVISLSLMLLGAMVGPGIYNRIMFLNCFGTYIVVFFAVISLVKLEQAYIDIALIYSMINFVATIAFLKYFRNKSLGKGT